MALLASACVGRQIPLQPRVEALAGVSRLPLTVGVYYDPSLHAKKVVTFSVYEFPIGEASEALFKQVFSTMFESAPPVPSRPPLPGNPGGLAAVIEPTIEDFKLTEGEGTFVEITYRFSLYAPQGTQITSWEVTGTGESHMQSFRELVPTNLGRATDLAMQDAARKLATVFSGIPEVREWLRQVGVRVPR